MTSADVLTIVARVLGGDTEAYAGIVRRFQADLWKVAAGMLHDVETTEVVVQEAFVKAYLHLDQFRPDGDFRRWIKAIARNVVREEFRARARERGRLEGYRQRLFERFENDEAEERREQEMAEALKRCRERLPGHAAEALELRYGQTFSFEEIARRLDRSVAAVRQLLSRTRIMLRDCIEAGMARPDPI